MSEANNSSFAIRAASSPNIVNNSSDKDECIRTSSALVGYKALLMPNDVEEIPITEYSLQKRRSMLLAILRNFPNHLPVIVRYKERYLYLIYMIDTTFHWISSDVSKRLGVNVSLLLNDTSPVESTSLKTLYSKSGSEDGFLYLDARTKSGWFRT